MEDDDSDAEMAHYGTDFSDDVDPNFDAKDIHNKDPLSDVTRESDPPFPRCPAAAGTAGARGWAAATIRGWASRPS